jgi:hypothetical protein
VTLAWRVHSGLAGGLADEPKTLGGRNATGLPVERHEIRSCGMPVITAILGVVVQVGAVPDDDVLAI